ncbi:related to cell cycle arrest protein BUB2 [Armillaria ostoyae]|uniref:Related to cell cycle arrest protein BUB2 n=4 Tax=Armillaria TaxID=47424 RepID=A0A284QNM7_ARMOS|nr:TBC-domain-containing protein [Armillaria mellea]KAK0241250.1 TBC-domain-containing protein [Armillaria nabsnona]KAK0454470.1 TBC-domain-containing protein [Armillaria borealis]PBK74015.1 TBC-domain-containing protein [Armillaria solidipes]PBK86939.1 TBC-domain-containing protein [Armillaria gallica]SJK98020.1 related to cell cycle arrest protein BUB2 [Armillaria ostoyae]
MSSSTATAHSFARLLNQPKISSKSRSSGEVDDGTKKLRRMILVDGIPSATDPTLRPRIWKILLRINDLSADTYLKYVARGPCEVREKIRNDTFRTLATDRGFKERVREDMLVRLLDAFVWKNHDRQESHQLGFTYVQGMNVLAAPFLFTMPSELEAFYCFSKFIEESCPLYVQPTLDGVHRGLKLLDKCLKIVDPDLFDLLRKKNLSAEIYAFPSVLTLCACTPPLDQVLRLWDFLLAFGVHLNVLCVIAQLLLIRDEVMSSSSPMRLLRTFPPLEAVPVIGIAVTLVRDLPPELYDELVKHPYEI